jgi:16S rRNA (uracil1498-N3)-methyltransferase
MRVPRIYLDSPLATGSELILPAGAHNHLIRVLRLGTGAQIALFDGHGNECRARLLAADRRGTKALIEERVERTTESPLSVTLAQGVARGERMDFTLQKAVELGVSRIIPVQTQRSVSWSVGERAAKRSAHWQGVIIAACEQCGRSLLPELLAPRPLPTWLEQTVVEDFRAYVLNPAGDRRLRDERVPEKPLLLLVGPEGGLADEEIAAATGAGFSALALGPRVLRTETAGIAALAALQALWGDLG